MNHLSWIKCLGLGIGLCGAFFAACSSGSSTGDGNGGGGGGSSGGGSGGGGASCTSPTLSVLFSPMYSAFDGTHTFQVPAIVNGDATGVTWAAADPSMVSLAPDPTTGGTMITVLKAGSTTITATGPNGTCGQSQLTVTAATLDDWNNGSQRYNTGYILPGRPDGGGGGFDASGFDAAVFGDLACTNCHGDNTNPNARYKDVQHTPEQTGGFSDDQLVQIFSLGQVPDGGYFDPDIICPNSRCTPDQAYARWQSFHTWDMTDAEKKGIIVYLRSLTPAAQTGSSNFGGRCDGGRCPRPDGGPRPDSGGGPQPDADTGNDSGNTGD